MNFEKKSDLPAIMLSDTKNENLEFLQPIESVTEDSIADIVMAYVFVDLI